MSYESPIKLTNTMDSIVKRVREEGDKKIYECIANYGIDVNKEELEKALRYDRDQYVKGYKDGKAEAMQWIPCSERLPEEEGWYLATVKVNCNLEIINIGEVLFKRANKAGKKKWYRQGQGNEVLAWMPLPPVFKGE